MPLRGPKRWLFTGLTFSLPFLVLAAVEAALRLAGWGGYPAFLRAAGRLPSGETLCLVEPAAAKPYFFANPQRPGYADQSTLVMPKPAGTVRIFLIGESAAKGYPQPRNLSMGAFLEQMLNSVWTGRHVEVISLGTTAVASFPLVYQVRDALRFAPDLFIFYTGNNEFFGAYGTGSINAVGTLPPVMQRVLRAARGLAIVQALGALLHPKTSEDRTLMEQMIGRAFIAADAPLRRAAARNLAENMGAMLDQLAAAKVPAVVCTTAGNEADLAPLGTDDVTNLDAAQQQQLAAMLDRGLALLAQQPGAAAEQFRTAVQLAPRHARARFLLGRALAAGGDRADAQAAFLAARDLDTLPWRPISQTEQALRDVARTKGVLLCDIADIFRRESSAAAIDATLLDDHVHLSLRGQARAARAMAAALTAASSNLQVDAAALATLPDDASMAKTLGANMYDDYCVQHTLRVLFGVPFMRRTNPETFARHDKACREAEACMAPGVLAAAREWQTLQPHAGGLRPFTGMAARALLREKRTAEALRLYQIASRQVPQYTSWYLEYVYFTLACREMLAGTLSAAEREAAARAIAQGRFLLANGYSQTGFTQRYLGRLHQLRGEWADAIPFLRAARPQMRAEDLVACDQALVLSYLKTGQRAEARAVVDEGLRSSGRFADVYRQLGAQVERDAAAPAARPQ